MYNMGKIRRNPYGNIPKCTDLILEPGKIGLPKGVKKYENATLTLLDLHRPKPKQIEWCSKNSYVIVPGPPKPMNLIAIHKMAGDFFCTRKNPWFAYEDSINKDRAESRWYIVRNSVLENSENKTLTEQMALMRHKETLLNMAEVAWLEIISKINFKSFLLPAYSTRTSTVFMKGRNICIGGSKISGISVSKCHDNTVKCRTIGLLTQLIL